MISDPERLPESLKKDERPSCKTGEGCADMTSVRWQLRKNLRTDRAYRRAFVCEHVDQNIPFQIRANREHRGWTQADLGRKARMAQARISVLEDPNYSKFTISTLKRLAAAFDTGLEVAFVPVSAVLDRSVNLANHLVSPAADEDPGLDEESDGTRYIAGGAERTFERGFSRLPSTPLHDFTITIGAHRQLNLNGTASGQIQQLQPQMIGLSAMACAAANSQGLGTATMAPVGTH